MKDILDIQRELHEDIDSLEERIVEELLLPQNTHRERLLHELNAARLLDEQIRLRKKLLDIYENQKEERQEAIKKSTIVGNDFSAFYAELDFLEKMQQSGQMSSRLAEFDSLVTSLLLNEKQFEMMFSGEESFGRFLDLNPFYNEYLNLKGVRSLDYLQYLDEYDNFESIPATCRSSGAYAQYCQQLSNYLESFIGRSMPLYDLESVMVKAKQSFLLELVEDKREGEEKGEFCSICKHLFKNKHVYQHHLSGKRHKKAALQSSKDKTDESENNKPNPSSNGQLENNVKFLERLIEKFSEILAKTRQETRANVERKQSMTVEEREQDLLLDKLANEQSKRQEKEDSKLNDEDDSEEIYNPLNLPLDWDGKPIPYWLWKLHGLGNRFPCEICGQHTYMGRKAFDQHFYEWRHSHAMKSLGIPNTKHFFQITKIDEAKALWDKLKKKSKKEGWKADDMEEFEDHLGNVYNRKTFEDLRNQGLI